MQSEHFSSLPSFDIHIALEFELAGIAAIFVVGPIWIFSTIQTGRSWLLWVHCNILPHLIHGVGLRLSRGRESDPRSTPYHGVVLPLNYPGDSDENSIARDLSKQTRTRHSRMLHPSGTHFSSPRHYAASFLSSVSAMTSGSSSGTAAFGSLSFATAACFSLRKSSKCDAAILLKSSVGVPL